jgi:hypothetical protein
VYFDAPEPAEIAVAVREVLSSRWDRDELTRHAESFFEEQFTMRIRAIAAQELQSAA